MKTATNIAITTDAALNTLEKFTEEPTPFEPVYYIVLR